MPPGSAVNMVVMSGLLPVMPVSAFNDAVQLGLDLQQRRGQPPLDFLQESCEAYVVAMCSIDAANFPSQI